MAEDTHKVCGNCGTPFINSDAVWMGVENSNYAPQTNTPEPKKSKKNIIVALVAVLVVLIIALVLLIVLLSGPKKNTPENVIDDVMSAFISVDGDKLVSLIPEEVIENRSLSSSDLNDNAKAIERFAQELFEGFEDETGSDDVIYKISVLEYYSDEFINIANEYNSYYDTPEVDEAAFAIIEIVSEDDEDMSYPILIDMINYNGHWGVADVGLELGDMSVEQIKEKHEEGIEQDLIHAEEELETIKNNRTLR